MEAIIQETGNPTPTQYNVFYALCVVIVLSLAPLLKVELNNESKKVVHLTLVVVFLTLPLHFTKQLNGTSYLDCAAHTAVVASLTFLGYRHVNKISGVFNTPVDFSPYVVALVLFVHLDENENMLHKALSMIPVLAAVMLMFCAINFMRQEYMWFVVICIVLALSQLLYDCVVEINK